MNFSATVSVTIPCKNEAAYIEKCVLSVLNCDYPKSLFKVFVVDGLSSDETPNIVNALESKYPGRVELIQNAKQFTPFALNLGLQQTGFDYKIILGAHSEVTPTYIAECVKILDAKPEVGCVGGVLENVFENETAEVVGLAMSSPFGVGNAHFRTGGKEGYVDTVAFGCYRDKVVQEIGLFDEDLVRNQDDEYNFRLLRSGAKIWLSPKIQAKYYVRASYLKLAKQYYQYGYWKVFVNKKHKTVTTIRQLIPLFLVLYFILGGLVAGVFPIVSPLIGLGSLIYFLGSFYFGFKTGKSKGVGVTFTFWILHFTYGWGYLRGLIRFIILGKKPEQRSLSLSR